MAHEKLNFTFTREWAKLQAKLEADEGNTSVGGLALRVAESKANLEALNAPAAQQNAESTDPRRQSLAKLVELFRRRMRFSVEKLAEHAQVDLGELLAIENANPVAPAPRTIYQLAVVFKVKPDPLMELAGLVESRRADLTESAVRFAARSEPMQALSRDEEDALNWFVKELTK